MSQTIYDICQDIRQTHTSGKAHKASPSIIQGRQKRNPPTKSGYVQITPEQILGVLIERLSVNGTVEGYQRRLSVDRSRRIARALSSGKKLAPPTLGLDNGRLFAVDGQHRLIGAVIAWKPLWVLIEPMSKEDRAERFSDQRLAVRPSSDLIALASDDPISDYIKDAIRAESEGTHHPLAGIVGERSNDSHIGAGTIYEHVSAYVLDQIGGNSAAKAFQSLLPSEQRKRFSREIADEYGALLNCFGNKQFAHPVIHRPGTLRALNDLSIMAVRRSPKKAEDIQRWSKRMPSFDWNGASWATRHMDIRPMLVAHWNKRLPQSRKVQF